VKVTGDSLNTLGFGSYLNGASPNQVEYTSITASSNYSTGTAGGNGTARLEISLGGGASNENEITAVLAGGDATRATTSSSALDASQNLSTNTGTLDIAVNGTTFNINLGTANPTTRETIAATINNSISAQGRAYLNSSNQIVIESNTVGSSGSVQILASSSATSLSFSGLTAGSAITGTNASLGNVLDQLNDAIQGDADLRAAGIRAVQSGSAIQLESTNGTFFRVASRVTGSDTADIGFGNLGSSYAGPLTQNGALTNNRVNSGGAEATALLGFTNITNGADDQSVTISALDANGVAQTSTVTLRNDASGRSGRSVDEAVAAINSALQASNSTSLRNIVAVKESDGTNEGIRFIGATKNFSVQASTTLNGGGINTSSSNNFAASTLAGGSNLVIDNQSSAEAAVTALASAVSTLGRAQAVVGRGQNQFNFAINLASSQLTNLAASESRIRDADLAAEAANLSKAQISVQAGVAALAQANSAPQAVLSLLRG
jgi:flagellin